MLVARRGSERHAGALGTKRGPWMDRGHDGRKASGNQRHRGRYARAWAHQCRQGVPRARRADASTFSSRNLSRGGRIPGARTPSDVFAIRRSARPHQGPAGWTNGWQCASSPAMRSPGGARSRRGSPLALPMRRGSQSRHKRQGAGLRPASGPAGRDFVRTERHERRGVRRLCRRSDRLPRQDRAVGMAARGLRQGLCLRRYLMSTRSKPRMRLIYGYTDEA